MVLSTKIRNMKHENKHGENYPTITVSKGQLLRANSKLSTWHSKGVRGGIGITCGNVSGNDVDSLVGRIVRGRRG